MKGAGGGGEGGKLTPTSLGKTTFKMPSLIRVKFRLYLLESTRTCTITTTSLTIQFYFILLKHQPPNRL